MAPHPKVSTIPPGTPFVDALAAGLLARHGGSPDALARATVLLPTRRACIALRDAFLRHSGGAALLLPRLTPLGDIDADEIEPGAGDAVSEAAAGDAPPAVSELERRLILARLILAQPAAAGDAGGAFARADQAVRLAADLARLLDQVQTEQLSFDGLAALAPADYAQHWQRTLAFLEIVTAHWPAILAERGLVDPAARRNGMLEALAARWRAAPPAGPVIAAGSTGSVPATADLLAVIARLPDGEVVLPGLDQDSGEAFWAQIDESHPQFGLKRLIERLAVDRDQVAVWPVSDAAPAVHPGRAALLNTALQPAETTATWAAVPPPPAAALDGLESIACPGPREEAALIALRLRHALETPGRTAALVTRNRALARRVAAELGRWGIEIDDSAGRPLAETATGSFLGLSAALVAEDAAPLALLAALKHPFAAGGLKPGGFRARVRALEYAVLRGPRPGAGFSGVAGALDAVGAPAALRRWFDRIADLAAPFAELVAGDRVSLGALAAAHLAFAEGLATAAGEEGPDRLWAGDAGEAAAAFFAELIEAAGAMPPLAGRDYPAVLAGLIEGRVVRPRHVRHPRLHIWGPLEARLQHADLMILGGLNEASWPPDPGADPWLSRPMRRRFGLPAPERRIGLSAHDFVQCASAPNVVLTRAAKVEGAPTVPSRWLARLENLLRGWEKADALAASPEWRAWPEMLDRPDAVRPAEPPAPAPPVAARPRRLSVTQIETWRRDPYAIYARHILRLTALDPIDADPSAAERGTVIHKALDRFVKAHPDALPDDACDSLIYIGRSAFAEVIARPSVRAFWWPRFERIARWFVETERDRRAGLAAIASEAVGCYELAGPGGTFVLTGKADRIERRRDGGLVIIDYKTGGIPEKQDIVNGYAPQLSLEAVIAEAGGFEGVAKTAVAELSYWRLTGGDPAGEEKPVNADAAALAAEALDGLRRLVADFDDPATPYHAVPDMTKAPRFNDYAHLARIREWADVDGGDGP